MEAALELANFLGVDLSSCPLDSYSNSGEISGAACLARLRSAQIKLLEVRTFVPNFALVLVYALLWSFQDEDSSSRGAGKSLLSCSGERRGPTYVLWGVLPVL